MTTGVTCNDIVSSFFMGVSATFGGVLVLVITVFIMSRLGMRFPLGKVKQQPTMSRPEDIG